MINPLVETWYPFRFHDDSKGVETRVQVNSGKLARERIEEEGIRPGLKSGRVET